MHAAYNSGLASYIRMGKADRGDVHKSEVSTFSNLLFDLHKASDSRVAILATGSMVKTALDLVNESFIAASVWSVPTIKPVNVKQVIEIFQNNDWIITMEEHSVFGGLGSVMAEISSEFVPRKILRIGVQDRFSHHCGTYEYLLKEHELDTNSIKYQIASFIRSK
jgi:transketolase